jgi:hypothetical protein
MELQTAVTVEPNYQIHSADLCADHRLLLELLSRYVHDGSIEAGRDLMHVAMDLFRLHCAIEAQVLKSAVKELEWECQALHELMETVEVAAAAGVLHLISVIELRLAMERFFAAKQIMMGPPQLLQVPNTRGNRALLRDRNDLTAYAQHLVRLH